jgi:hypothetical protein
MSVFSFIGRLFKKNGTKTIKRTPRWQEEDVNLFIKLINDEVNFATKKLCGTIQKVGEENKYLRRVIREISKPETDKPDYDDTNMWIHQPNANPLIKKDGNTYTLHLGSANPRTVKLNKAEARAVCLGLLWMFSDIERDIRDEVRSKAKADLTHVAAVAYDIKDSEVTETHLDELAVSVQDMRRYCEEETVRIEK